MFDDDFSTGGGWRVAGDMRHKEVQFVYNLYIIAAIVRGRQGCAKSIVPLKC